MGTSQVSQAQILRSNSLKKAIQIMEENDKKTFGAKTMKSAATKEKASAHVMKGVSAAAEKNNCTNESMNLSFLAKIDQYS